MRLINDYLAHSSTIIINQLRVRVQQGSFLARVTLYLLVDYLCYLYLVTCISYHSVSCYLHVHRASAVCHRGNGSGTCLSLSPSRLDSDCVLRFRNCLRVIYANQLPTVPALVPATAPALAPALSRFRLHLGINQSINLFAAVSSASTAAGSSLMPQCPQPQRETATPTTQGGCLAGWLYDICQQQARKMKWRKK